MTEYAPVSLFVFNRPEHTLKTLESLKQNEIADKTDLIIFSDGPRESMFETDKRKVDQVRKIIGRKKWCKKVEIVESSYNKGLAANIYNGITGTLDKYHKTIVLEDDIVVGKGFLIYMNKALNLYEHNNKVMHISAYIPPIKATLPDTFFTQFLACWGWGTWSRAWKYNCNNAEKLLDMLISRNLISKFNFDNTSNFSKQLKDNISGKINTWAIKWYASVFLNDGLCLSPGRSLVRNIGFDSSGTHCGRACIYQNQTYYDHIEVYPINTRINRKAMKKFKTYNKLRGDYSFQNRSRILAKSIIRKFVNKY